MSEIKLFSDIKDRPTLRELARGVQAFHASVRITFVRRYQNLMNEISNHDPILAGFHRYWGFLDKGVLNDAEAVRVADELRAYLTGLADAIPRKKPLHRKKQGIRKLSAFRSFYGNIGIPGYDAVADSKGHISIIKADTGVTVSKNVVIWDALMDPKKFTSVSSLNALLED